jgi:predicted DNA-binding transcriptional regulator AlpA
MFTGITPAGASPTVLTPRASQIETLPAGARLNARDIMSLLDCSKSTLLRRVAAGRAPAPIAIGEWRADSVREFFAREVDHA